MLKRGETSRPVAALYTSHNLTEPAAWGVMPRLLAAAQIHCHSSRLGDINAQGGRWMVWFLMKQGKGREVVKEAQNTRRE